MKMTSNLRLENAKPLASALDTGKGFWLIMGLGLTALIVYLFVTAPSELPEAKATTQTIPIGVVLEMAQAENANVRGLYTREIVGAGQKAGLTFSEDWREENVQAGPLPALFLRETAMSLEKNPVRLGLFLGSDAPINASNQFMGVQAEKFELIRQTGNPQLFYASDIASYAYMFPDIAQAEGCITCHNTHADTPKQDWQLNDIMGATTWIYPDEYVTLDEALVILQSLRQGFADSYSAYLAEVATFDNPPEIGDKWPRDGYYLPSLDVFMQEVERLNSTHSLDTLMELANSEH